MSDWRDTQRRLRESEPALYELEPGGALALDLTEDGWLLEVTPDGRLLCQAGMDMESIQSLLSEGTPEDLGTDELAKQAKYYLQPMAAKVRTRLVGAGFEENTEMNDEYVAVVFQHPVDVSNIEDLRSRIKWCREIFKS